MTYDDSTELLTMDEHACVDALGKCFGMISKITGNGPSRAGDLQEAAHHIHALQNMVLAQAAAREYREYRTLGEDSFPGAMLSSSHGT